MLIQCEERSEIQFKVMSKFELNRLQHIGEKLKSHRYFELFIKTSSNWWINNQLQKSLSEAKKVNDLS